MALNVFFFLLLFFLILSLVRLCHLSVFHHGLAHWRAGAMHPIIHRLRHRPVPHAIVRPVAFPPPSQRVRGHRLSLCAPGPRSKADGEPPNA
jgi:hypothetical protein